jgi:hypothetical protein
MILPASLSILIGLGMIGQWVMSYLTKQIPELQSEPIRIWFHIAGEMITAVLLIVGGISLLTPLAWGPVVYLVAMGMLVYTAIVSPGYFAQKGQWIWVWIFGGLILLALISVIIVANNLIG